jgi:hypothetical protein
MHDVQAYPTMSNATDAYFGMLAGSETLGYYVRQCPMNIMIQQPAPQGSRNDVVVDPAAQPTHIITFNGTQYARYVPPPSPPSPAP